MIPRHAIINETYYIQNVFSFAVKSQFQKVASKRSIYFSHLHNYKECGVKALAVD